MSFSLYLSKKSYFRQIVLYLFIFAPIFQVINIGIVKFFWIPALVYLILKKKYYNKSSLLLLLLLILLFFYHFLISLRNPSFGFIEIYSFTIFIVESLIVCYAIQHFFNYNSVDILIYDYKIIGSIAVLISLFLLINPEINYWVKDKLIVDTLAAYQGVDLDLYRGFSIAQGSSFEYGVCLGLIFSIILLLDKSIVYSIILFIPYVISIMINARTGILILILGLVIYILNRRKFIYILNLLIFFIFIIILSYFFVDINNQTVLWALSFVDEMKSILSGNFENTTLGTLNSMISLPENLFELFFGKSFDVYGSLINRSDVGYIVDIQNGGLFLLSLKFFVLTFILFSNFNYKIYLPLYLLFILTIIVSNYKGPSLLLSLAFVKLIFFTHFSLSNINNNHRIIS